MYVYENPSMITNRLYTFCVFEGLMLNMLRLIVVALQLLSDISSFKCE